MSTAQANLAKLLIQTKSTLAFKLSEIYHNHYAATSAQNADVHPFQSCYALLDPLVSYLTTHSTLIPPGIIQQTKNQINTLNNVILEVQLLLLPENVIDLSHVYSQTVSDYDDYIATNSSMIDSFLGDHGNTLILNAKKNMISDQKFNVETDTIKKSPSHVKLHKLEGMKDAIIIFVTQQQFINDFLVSDHHSLTAAHIEYNKPHLISSQSDYLNNNQTHLNHDANLSTSFNFTMLSSDVMGNIASIISAHAILFDTLFSSPFPPSSTTFSPKKRDIYLYICANQPYQSNTYPNISSQPPLLINNINNSLLLQYNPLQQPQLKTSSPDTAHIPGSTTCNNENTSNHLFLFSSVTCTNISNSLLYFNAVDSSLHMTHVYNSICLVQCHQLRLHHISHTLFAANQFSHFFDLYSRTCNTTSQNNKISPHELTHYPDANHHKLEPILEDSNNLIFTTMISLLFDHPPPRDELLTVYDFNRLIQQPQHTEHHQHQQLPEHQPSGDDHAGNIDKNEIIHTVDYNYMYLDQMVSLMPFIQTFFQYYLNNIEDTNVLRFYPYMHSFSQDTVVTRDSIKRHATIATSATQTMQCDILIKLLSKCLSFMNLANKSPK